MSQAGRDDRVIPLVEEDVSVEKRSVETGRVTISTKIEERRDWIEETLRREDVSVERIPVGRVVTDALPAVREEDGVLIVPLFEEELVIEKRLILKEELHIRRNVRMDQVREPVTIRSQRAVVTREAASPQGDRPPSSNGRPIPGS